MRYAHLDKKSLASAVEKLAEVEIEEKAEPALKIVANPA
jgi:hypothetical protein